MNPANAEGMRAARDLIFYFISKSDGAATLISRGTNFKDIVGRTLTLYADGGTTAISVKFVEGNFAAPTSPTVAEIVTALNANTAFAAAFTASALGDGRLQIVSDTTGTVSQIVVGNGTANPVFGWVQGLDIDVSDQTIAVPVYSPEEEMPPLVERWVYTVSTQLYEKIVPTTSETIDYDGEVLTIPGAVTTVGCVRIAF